MILRLASTRGPLRSPMGEGPAHFLDAHAWRGGGGGWKI